MQDAAVAGIIQKKPKMKASRSLPPMVLKPAPKSRVSCLQCMQWTRLEQDTTLGKYAGI